MRLNPLDGLLYLSAKLCSYLSKRPRPLSEFDPQKINRILLVSSTAIGDTLLSTPAIRALRERYPQAILVGQIDYNYIELFANNPHLNKIIPYYGGYHRFISTVMAFRRERLDAAVILHGNGPQAIPMAYFSGAPFVVRIPNRSDYRFLLSNSAETAANECNPAEHGIQDRLRAAALLGSAVDNKHMVLLTDEADRQSVGNYLAEKGFAKGLIIGFQAAASTVSRMWPKERFVQLGQKILAKIPDAKIIITGSPQERNYCQEVAALINSPKVLVSAGDLPLKQVPALIERMNLLVTGDTGIMHIAIACGTPTVSLFAVADPRKSAACYDLDKHLVIYKGKTCDPCPGKRCKNPICMEQIEVDEVWQAAQQSLKRFFSHKATEPQRI